MLKKINIYIYTRYICCCYVYDDADVLEGFEKA